MTTTFLFRWAAARGSSFRGKALRSLRNVGDPSCWNHMRERDWQETIGNHSHIYIYLEIVYIQMLAHVDRPIAYRWWIGKPLAYPVHVFFTLKRPSDPSTNGHLLVDQRPYQGFAPAKLDSQTLLFLQLGEFCLSTFRGPPTLRSQKKTCWTCSRAAILYLLGLSMP